MNQKLKDILLNIAGFVAVFTFIFPVIPFGVYALWHNNHTTCSNQIVPFKVTIDNSDPSAPSEGTVETTGVNGMAHICTKGGKQVSKTILKQPTNEVDAVGNDAPPEYPDPPGYDDYLNGNPDYHAPTYQAPNACVTNCADGTCSSSTGRGTCSWHGGEAY